MESEASFELDGAVADLRLADLERSARARTRGWFSTLPRTWEPCLRFSFISVLTWPAWPSPVLRQKTRPAASTA